MEHTTIHSFSFPISSLHFHPQKQPSTSPFYLFLVLLPLCSSPPNKHMATLRCVSFSSYISRPPHHISGIASLQHRCASANLRSPFSGTFLNLSIAKPSSSTKRRPAPSATKVQMTAKIQFIQGIDEQTIPDIRLTKSRDGTNGVAIFTFNEPSLFDSSSELGDITGFFMIDEEGVIQSVDVSAKFINGKPSTIEAKHVMRTPREWDRFMRFMERYSQANGLQFVKK